jgi:glycerol-3-phosphate dehydrogenase (NAD(P)+)
MALQTISIIGAGSWGTTLGLLLAQDPNNRVLLWAAFDDHVARMRSDRANNDFLKGYPFSDNIEPTSDLKAASLANVIFLAVPTQFMRDVLKKMKATGVDFNHSVIVTVSKGIELATLTTPFEIIADELAVSKNRIVVLSGPTIATEVARGVPTVAAAACFDADRAERVQRLFEKTHFRVYRNDDPMGVERAAALKNVIAIACGIADGLGFGTNTKSALVTRGLREMVRFGHVWGVKDETFMGVTGLGDLCTTCFSSESRNRGFGERLGKGEKADAILAGMKMVAEGVVTAKSVYQLSKKHGLEMPIVTEVYRVIYEGKEPKDAVRDLMARPLKSE